MEGDHWIRPHPNAAKLWIEFSATDEYQKYLSENAALHITGKNVNFAFSLPELKFVKIDRRWLKDRKEEMIKRFEEEIDKGGTEGK